MVFFRQSLRSNEVAWLPGPTDRTADETQSPWASYGSWPLDIFLAGSDYFWRDIPEKLVAYSYGDRSMALSSDAQGALLSAARGGQPEALDSLLAAYRNYLKLLARTQIDRRWRARIDPSDLVQETLLDACHDIQSFRGHTPRELMAWLRRILARNLASQIKRQQQPKRDVRRDASLEDALDRSSEAVVHALRSAASSPSEHACKDEQSVRLADVLERLPQEYREVILLRQFEGLPFKQIASELQRSPGAVRMLFARAIDRLRRELRGDQS
jgi:RNA polymerase sigma-70 factor (ECF subfamily)